MKAKLLSYYKKYLFIIWPAGATIISLLMLSLIVVPNILSLIKTKNESYEITQRTEKLSQKATELKAINTTEYQNNLNTLIRVLPKEKDVGSTLDQLQNLAASNRLQIVNLSYVNNNNEKIDNFQIKTEMIGSLSDLQNLMSTLKSSEKIMKITQIELTGTTDPNLYNASLMVVAYFQSLPKEIGGTDASVTKLTSEEKVQIAKFTSSVLQNSSIASISESITGPRGKVDPFK